MSKIKLATVWLDGCSGCHMSFLDMDERLLDLSSQFDLVYSPLVDNKVYPQRSMWPLWKALSAVSEDEHKIQHIRKHTRLLIAMGDCAVTGNVSAMRNPYGPAAHPRARLSRECQRSAADALQDRSRAAGEGSAHPRVRERRSLSPRMPAFGRHLFHRRNGIACRAYADVASLTRFGA